MGYVFAFAFVPLLHFCYFSLISCAIIHNVLNDVLNGNAEELNSYSSYLKHFHNRTEIYDICSGLIGEYLIACCKPSNVKIMENVMVRNGEFHLYAGHRMHRNKSTRLLSALALPPISNLYYRQVSKFTMKVNVKYEALHADSCKSFFNGTLQVSSRWSIHNLFHACTYFSGIVRLYDLCE